MIRRPQAIRRLAEEALNAITAYRGGGGGANSASTVLMRQRPTLKPIDQRSSWG